MTLVNIFKKHQWQGFGFMLFVFFLIYCTDSALVNTNVDRLWARLSWVGIVVVSLIIIPTSKYRTNDIIYLILFSLAIFISMLFTEYGFNVNCLQRIILLWLACAIARGVAYDGFMMMWIKIIRFIAVFSVVCVVLAPVIRTLPLPILSCGENASYISLFFTNVSLTSARNYGPFWEPGAFQLYLNWALFYEVRNKDKLKLLDVFIFSVAIITTRSTGGFAILGLVYLFYFLSNRSDNDKNKRYLTRLVLPIFLLGLGYIVYKSTDIGADTFDKVAAMQENSDEMTSANYSTYTRIYSVPASIDVIKEKPLFGAGIDGLKDDIMKSYGLVSNTNSLLAMPATFGFLAGILYLLLFVRSSFKKGRNLILSLIFFLILMAMYCTENLMASLMFWIILFYESYDKSMQKPFLAYPQKAQL